MIKKLRNQPHAPEWEQEEKAHAILLGPSNKMRRIRQAMIHMEI
jgi:hypothetical protein